MHNSFFENTVKRFTHSCEIKGIEMQIKYYNFKLLRTVKDKRQWYLQML